LQTLPTHVVNATAGPVPSTVVVASSDKSVIDLTDDDDVSAVVAKPLPQNAQVFLITPPPTASVAALTLTSASSALVRTVRPLPPSQVQTIAPNQQPRFQLPVCNKDVVLFYADWFKLSSPWAAKLSCSMTPSGKCQ